MFEQHLGAVKYHTPRQTSHALYDAGRVAASGKPGARHGSGDSRLDVPGLFADALPGPLVEEIRTCLQQEKALGSDRFRSWVKARTGWLAAGRLGIFRIYAAPRQWQVERRLPG